MEARGEFFPERRGPLTVQLQGDQTGLATRERDGVGAERGRDGYAVECVEQRCNRLNGFRRLITEEGER